MEKDAQNQSVGLKGLRFEGLTNWVVMKANKEKSATEAHLLAEGVNGTGDKLKTICTRERLA